MLAWCMSNNPNIASNISFEDVRSNVRPLPSVWKPNSPEGMLAMFGEGMSTRSVTKGFCLFLSVRSVDITRSDMDISKIRDVKGRDKKY